MDDLEFCKCIYCGDVVELDAPVPPADDDEAWMHVAASHARSCEWVATRGHQRDRKEV